MMDKLQAEIESMPPGTIMDPEGAGVQALEEAEEYFRTECDKLCDIRDALERSGGSEAHGKAIIDQLDRVQFALHEGCRMVPGDALALADQRRHARSHHGANVHERRSVGFRSRRLMSS